MQTILGANGQIGTELARELHDSYTTDIRLVSRHPRKLHDTDELLSADLMNAVETDTAVAGSDIVYLTVGLPPDSALWAEQLPTMMKNTIDACEKHGAKLVFFDNTYMYPMTSAPQTEGTPFSPNGSKGRTRAAMTTMLLDAMERGRVEAVICRARSSTVPGRPRASPTPWCSTPSRRKKARVPLSADTRRSLIWTPDASRAMALIGNTASAYGQTWHLPVDKERITYKDLVRLAAQRWEREVSYAVVPKIVFAVGRLFSKNVRELWELLPRYAVDNIFVTDKFTDAFPDFRVTTYAEGVAAIHRERARS